MEGFGSSNRGCCDAQATDVVIRGRCEQVAGAQKSQLFREAQTGPKSVAGQQPTLVWGSRPVFNLWVARAPGAEAASQVVA